MKQFADQRDWFFEKRFGLFVHWGLYAIPAWHEQILWRGSVRRQDYERLMLEFNPVNYDPEAWLDVMQEAGMEFIVFTTKHHDGFCMWNTKCTEYNIMNTPYGKDVLQMLAESCRRRGILLGLYYSCPDWHHPNYPNQGRHHEMFGPRAGDDHDLSAYYKFVREQVRELCTNYGEICQFFWDVNVAEHYDPSINEMIRALQPKVVINDRGPGPGDFATPERRVPPGKAFSQPTQACQSLGRESWGYRDGEDYYSHKHLIQSIDKILAMGGSYLLNVGPKADGAIAAENIRDLQAIGKWFGSVREAFTDTYPASYLVDPDTMLVDSQTVARDDVLITRQANCVYVHLYQDPQTSSILLKPLDVLPERVTLLNDGRELQAVVDTVPWHWREKPYLRICNIPVNEFVHTVMVLKLEFSEAINE